MKILINTSLYQMRQALWGELMYADSDDGDGEEAFLLPIDQKAKKSNKRLIEVF